ATAATDREIRSGQREAVELTVGDVGAGTGSQPERSASRERAPGDRRRHDRSGRVSTAIPSSPSRAAKLTGGSAAGGEGDCLSGGTVYVRPVRTTHDGDRV